MARDGYNGTTLSAALYSGLEALGKEIGQELGLKPLSVPEVIALEHQEYIKKRAEEAADDDN
jgi:hypothetical protein